MTLPNRNRALPTAPDLPGLNSYVATLSKRFLGLSCGKGNFGAADVKFAEELARRGVSLAVVEDVAPGRSAQVAIVVEQWPLDVDWQFGIFPTII